MGTVKDQRDLVQSNHLIAISRCYYDLISLRRLTDVHTSMQGNRATQDKTRSLLTKKVEECSDILPRAPMKLWNNWCFKMKTIGTGKGIWLTDVICIHICLPTPRYIYIYTQARNKSPDNSRLDAHRDKSIISLLFKKCVCQCFVIKVYIDQVLYCYRHW